MLKTGELFVILELHRQGLSVSAIARQLDLDRKTFRKYIARGLEPLVTGRGDCRSECADSPAANSAVYRWARLCRHAGQVDGFHRLRQLPPSPLPRAVVGRT